MAQSGYGYDPLHSYHPQNPYAHQPYPPYAAPALSYPNPVVRTVVHNESAPGDPYNPHNAIPGLGLNYSQNAMQWQGPWPNQQSSFGQEPLATTEVNRPEQHTDISEEGEVSEGGLEDAYEPRDAEVFPKPSHMNRSAQNAAGFNDVPPASFPASRDRSGSYSPYLSPHEMDHPAMTASVNEGQLNQITPMASSQTSPKANRANHIISNSSQVKSVGATRKQAQDAIRRLWTLNVRYQNFVDEGIDETLLGNLFEELGFEMGAPHSSTTVQSGLARGAVSETKTTDEPRRTDGIPQQTETEKSAGSAPAKDASESRKDRIARLLAAKNSKSNTAATNAPSPSTPAPALAPASKAQTEKSKLLYKKMEALRKARELEARGRKRSYPDELPLQSHQANSDADNSTASSSHNMAAGGLHRTSPEHTSGEISSLNGQLPPSIPGLFLSSTPQPPHATQVLNLERPASTSLVDSNPRPFKRPFGHVRRPRPFLIDVSDDEDDAEMDLDSPEQRTMQLATKEAVPPSLQTTLSFRSAPSFGDSAAAAQQYSSPMATPPGASSDNSATRDNLDNMTKKIEAMKKRIAEAEARKKAKQSRLNSPALPALLESPNISFEAVIPSQELAVHMPSTSIEAQELSRSTPPMSNSSPMAPSRSSEASPQSGNERRSRSVAASERLPFVEARRREQQLKLKLLRAQVENMQREIQRTMEEEEKLRIDVNADSDSEGTHEQQAPSPSKILSPSSPLPDSMDITSISPQSNNATRRSREATPLPSEQSQNQQQPSLLVAIQAEHNPLDVESNGVIEAVEDDSHPPNVEANTIIEDVDDAKRIIEDVDDAKKEATQDAMSSQDDINATATASVEEARDMVMSEAADSSNHASEEESDSYEPPEVELSSPSKKLSRASTPFSPAPASLDSIPNANADSLLESTADVIAGEQISTVHPDIASESGREVDVLLHFDGRSTYLIGDQADPVSEAPATPASDAPRTAFVPYESPLRYFHAYRFHPEYSQSISGGLRSLTYSNRIDVKQEVCPDELANQSCPRGSECVYQHFENMQAPDDQILLQLGAHEEFGEQEKQQYINGLRNLLTDFRNRKVKDFQTISQGIIDYRAQFLGDRSKILPLGGVTI
ncbi:hypothetical protein TGAM01_v206385 [Trichoderma gamsii]|uniref:C3H1-type domain-containing protein n=1 Tax=Trichoderma gamsii TaxID=398673 RepID=A0A2P4ZKN8_9HYPO|nr:hypothetical protein TGAM01_v206385 [Trichoderma gamsii]PON24877.1 hypothetical protein TGAM01_v206385 [Trichoderma gamsii]